ncbi:MAG TPA: nitroreductase/quinone reductase family protein, partial [Mycobacterium sp.]
NPQAHVEVGTDAFGVTARELPAAEREELFPKVTAVAPGFAEYQAKTRRVIPLFELQRTYAASITGRCRVRWGK